MNSINLLLVMVISLTSLHANAQYGGGGGGRITIQLPANGGNQRETRRDDPRGKCNNARKLNALSKEMTLPNMCYGSDLEQAINSLQSVLASLQNECYDLIRDVEQFGDGGRKKTAEQKMRNRVQVFEIRANMLMYPVRRRIQSGRLACEKSRSEELVVYKAIESFLDNYCQIPKMLSCQVENCQRKGDDWEYWGVKNFNSKKGPRNSRRF